MAVFNVGDSVWLLSYDEVTDHHFIGRSEWNRAFKRNPHTVGSVLPGGSSLTFRGGYIHWPVRAFVGGDPNNYKPIEVGDLL